MQHVRESDIANEARLAAHEVHILDPAGRHTYNRGHARLRNQVDFPPGYMRAGGR
jgi:hypothetical protein